MVKTYTKDQLNTRLLAEDRKKKFEKSTEAENELYGKKATLLGEKGGETVGGILSLDTAQMSASEVLLGQGICSIEEGVASLSGLLDPDVISLNYSTATPTANLDSTGAIAFDSAAGGFVESVSGGDDAAKVASIITLLTGLAPLKDMGAKLTSGGSIPSIKDAMDQGAAGAKSLANDLKQGFTDLGASAGELTDIDKVAQAVEFGSIEDVIKDVSSVKSLNPAAKLKDVISDQTALGVLNETQTKAKNSLDKVNTITKISQKVKDTFGTINSFINEVETFTSDTLRGLKTGLLGKGVLGDVVEKVSSNASSVLNRLSGTVFSDAKKQALLENVISGDTKLFTSAVKDISLADDTLNSKAVELASIVEEGTIQRQVDETRRVLKENGVAEADIENIVDKINTVSATLISDVVNTTISGSVFVDPIFEEAESLIKINEKWAGKATSSDAFTYIASVEELESEFTLIGREITEVVIHASDTHTNKNIGSVEINEIHNQLGHDGIGYHYVIRRDGRLQRGRPPNKVGDHAPVNNHNLRSLGVVLVGGINASTGASNSSELRSAQSFTREQFTTLEKFLSVFYQRYPGGQVFGHNDIDVEEFDPYFDVPDYVEAVFRKKNTVTDTFNTEPLKSSEIV